MSSYTAEGALFHRGYAAFSHEAAALYLARNAFSSEGPLRHGALRACLGEGLLLHRAANDALHRYELFRGINAPPDCDADAPWETFAAVAPHAPREWSSPYVTAALDPAPSGMTRIYHFILQQRNRYNLRSQARTCWTVAVDDEGQQVATPPSGPSEVGIAPALGGRFSLEARYLYPVDADDQATAWLIYLKTGGGNPDPDVDTPVVEPMLKADGTARLDYTSAVYAPGTVGKALVRVRRVDAGPVNVDSENVEMVTATATATGPDAPAAAASLGSLGIA